MRIEDIQNIFFVGVGGIGMSALARYFNVTGNHVAGYDRTRTELTSLLEEEGINVSYTDSADEIGVPFRNASNTVVIVTPAIPKENAILNWFKKGNFRIYKRAEVLGLISRQLNSICIAGTHGKTSISTMVAYLLNESEGCNAFLGGISANYKSNLVLDARSRNVVIEADEYDRSFLHLRPDVALISAMDADHLDIYKSEDQIHKAFQDFIKLIKHEGTLIMHKDLELSGNLPLTRSYYTYSFTNPEADFYAQNVSLKDEGYKFDFICPRHRIKDLQLRIPGILNAENMLGAIAIGCMMGMTDEQVRKFANSYQGVHRRFQVHFNNGAQVYIDDYAHHPEEIRKTLVSVKGIWPDKKIKVVFQPHLFSRTNDFYREFAQALDAADEVLIMDIYPARELPMEGVNSQMIADAMQNENVMVLSKSEVLPVLQQSKPEVLITMGAGDIDTLVKDIKQTVFNG